MYYYLIVVSKENPMLDDSLDAIWLHNDFKFIDDAHILVNDTIYEYEYLIFTDKINFSFEGDNFIIEENNVPVTNFFKQTSVETIYYLKEDNLLDDIKQIVNEE